MNTSQIPEKIARFNVYLNDTKLIGHGEESKLPTFKRKTSTTSGAGLGGDIDSPTAGQYESAEHDLTFNLAESGAADVLKEGEVLNITLRAAQQMVNSDTHASEFVPLRVVLRGRIKEIDFGTIKAGDPMKITIKYEVTYFLFESNGITLREINKLTGDDSADTDLISTIKSMV